MEGTIFEGPELWTPTPSWVLKDAAIGGDRCVQRLITWIKAADFGAEVQRVMALRMMRLCMAAVRRHDGTGCRRVRHSRWTCCFSV